MGKKLNVKHTMLVRGTEHGDDEEAWYRASTATEFDVVEGDEHRFPLAFSFQREAERSPSLIRLDQATGRLFQRIGTLTGFDGEQNVEYSDRYPTKALVWNVSREAERLQREGHVVRGDRVTGVDLEWLRHHVSLNKQDLVEGFKAFDTCMRDWMFMDKYLWKAVPEPMFHVYRTNEGWKTALVPAPSLRHGGANRRDYHFGLGQYEELISWKERLTELTGRASTLDQFEAFNVYDATGDGYRVDLEFVLDDIVERFAKHSDPLNNPAVKALDLARMPYALFEVFSRARHLRHTASINWSDDVAVEIVEFIDVVADFVEENPQYADLFAKPKENALHQDKWHARPISVMATLGFLSTP